MCSHGGHNRSFPWQSLGNFTIILRERAKFIGKPGPGLQTGGNHFFGKKKKGAKTFFRRKKGGQAFFSEENKTGRHFFFMMKKGGHEIFSISIVQILLSKIIL